LRKSTKNKKEKNMEQTKRLKQQPQPHIWAFSSLLGAMAEPNAWPEFSCIKADGTLDEARYDYFMRTFAYYGANATREFPFHVPENHQPQGQTNYLPYVFCDGKYDLNQYNEVYFHNLKRMALIANSRGHVFFVSVTDRCHQLNMDWSPWNLNHQGARGFQLVQIDKWTRKILDTLQGTVFGIEDINENRSADIIPILVRIIKIAKEYGLPNTRIIHGTQYIMKWTGKEEVPHPLFQKFSSALKREGLRDFDYFERNLHEINEKFLVDFAHIQRYRSNWFLSDDGVHPKRSHQWWLENLTKFFATRKGKRNRLFYPGAGFEHLYRYPADDIAGVWGIVRAYEIATGKRLLDGGGTPRVIPEAI
jgi:hypothetical protein